jgi:hypothetical protein
MTKETVVRIVTEMRELINVKSALKWAAIKPDTCPHIILL